MEWVPSKGNSVEKLLLKYFNIGIKLVTEIMTLIFMIKLFNMHHMENTQNMCNKKLYFFFI